jgi:hypothetical protein
MARGVSIHIGLNKVDPAGYDGWSGVLKGCEADALAMEKIAKTCGYETKRLLTSDATSNAVCAAIGQAAQDLGRGDYLLLTYSGHGGQVPDSNGDEDDGQDETWVLYDRMLVDDELYALWSQFVDGVRIFVLSDSCHSGTVVKMMLKSRDAPAAPSPKESWYRTLGEMAKGTKAVGFPQPDSRYKDIPGGVQARAWEAKSDVYRTDQWVAGRPKDRPVNASVILISGCQDSQLSMDGDQNGLFTENLLAVWNEGAFSQGHAAFCDAIRARMPATQVPNYFTTGATASDFEDARPFVIDGATSTGASTLASEEGTTPDRSDAEAAGSETITGESSGGGTVNAPGTPSITGPESVSQDQAPTFTVNPAGNPYYIVEFADAEGLLDSPPGANDAHYYGTWADPNERARLTDASYRVTDEAWAKISGASKLYCRVSTTSSSSADKWDDYRTSSVQQLTVTPTRAKRSAPPPAAKRNVARPRSEKRDGL